MINKTKYQTEVTEMKNTIKGLNSRLDEAERINELEDRAMELTQAGQQKEKKE